MKDRRHDQDEALTATMRDRAARLRSERPTVSERNMGVLPIGLTLVTVALLLFAQLPVHGHYFRDLFPGCRPYFGRFSAVCVASFRLLEGSQLIWGLAATG